MAEATLAERVATLEQLVAQLMHTSERTARKKDWRRTIGMFDGDPIMQEILAEGRRRREEDMQRKYYGNSGGRRCGLCDSVYDKSF
jgi:hypothetical protein